ncbi:hypothetical protein DWX43_01665 [Clostridium sp. AF19-22AC]|nr:hypothetical protein DWX43_01665 [Clostridium sp. AF19-22AC]
MKKWGKGRAEFVFQNKFWCRLKFKTIRFWTECGVYLPFSRFFTYSFLARVQDTEAAHRPPQEYSPPRHQRPHLLSEKSSVLSPYLENKKCSPFFVVSDWG